MLRVARTWWPEQASLAKADGMVHFYLEGKKPFAKQVCPKCLRDQRVDLLIC